MVDLPTLIAYVSRMSDELERAWGDALDARGIAMVEDRLESEWEAFVSVIQLGAELSVEELTELGIDATVPEDPLPLQSVADLQLEPSLEERRRQLQQAQLNAFELVLAAVQHARRVEPRPPDRITGEAAAGWFESGAFALVRSRAELLSRITDLLEHTETDLVRAAHGDVRAAERPLEVPAFLRHRGLAAAALAHGDVEASLLHALVAVRSLIAAVANVDGSDISGPLASCLGDTVEARVVSKLEALEPDLVMGLGHKMGAAFLVARAMFVVLDRLIVAPPVETITNCVHRERDG